MNAECKIHKSKMKDKGYKIMAKGHTAIRNLHIEI
jgi:hypothetical protein